MAKARKAGGSPRVKPRSLPAAKSAVPDPHVEFLVMSLMSAIVPMIEAKCGALNKRDTNTLKRHVEKAVRQFVRGTK